LAAPVWIATGGTITGQDSMVTISTDADVTDRDFMSVLVCPKE